jgi:hypothetical protein
MVLLSLIPQINLWIVRGRDWNGAYVSPQGDEAFYSAYVNALIDGRTRKNDPFGGKDTSSSEPLPESIFSIQFVPAYVVALPARIVGISASTAFIILIATAALFASLSVFWLLEGVSGDGRFAAAGTLFVLCLGCIIGRHGIFGTFLDIGPAAFPFLRRYQPAVPFPLFFLFQLLVWWAFTTELKRRRRGPTILAGLTLTVLIFSHLYLWTAAAAWLVAMGALWFYFRPADRRKVLECLITIGGLAAVALVPYTFMLSQRGATLDAQQILISTHRPDLLRLHEVLGAGILVTLVIGIWRRGIQHADPRVLYAASLGLLPFIVFNQQVLTGRTMQAFHFEVAVVNYSILVALLITVGLLWKSLSRCFLIWMSALSVCFAVLVVGLPARLIFVPQAIANDRSIPVLLRLKELSGQDGTLAGLRTKGQASTMVFSPSVSLIAWLPTWTAQPTLLDMTGVDCRAMTRAERKKLFFMHLYYSNADIEALRKALNGTIDKSHDELSSVRTVTFGYERTSPALTPQFEPIRPDEVEREMQIFQTYVSSFSREEAMKRPITYAVIPVEGNFDFTNLDRWYERDAGERVGDYVLYRLKLRP